MFEAQEIKREAFILLNNCSLDENTLEYIELIELLEKTTKTYLNGSKSTLEKLSFYDRILDKSNQSVENYNRTKNRKAREAAKLGTKTSKNFCSQVVRKFHKLWLFQLHILFKNKIIYPL